MALASLWASEQRATNRSGHGATGSTLSSLSSHQSDITPTANITVTSTSDVANSTDGLCSLREAITAANSDVASGVLAGECVAGSSSGSDTIDLSGVAGTISLTTALPDIGSGMTILGPGANILTVRRSTASGTPSFRIFNIQGSTVAISGMTISGGDLANAGGGAGILNSGGSLTLADSSVSFNRVTGLNTVGGGILNINNGSLTLTNSSVNANTAPTGGGIRSDSGTVKITNSTLSRNSSGAVSSRFTNLFLYNSTISDNSTGTNGNGAGIFADGGTMVVYNCTIAGNRTGFGGSGGGIFSDLGGQGSVFLRNNIIAQNTNQNTPSCAGTINHPRPCSLIWMAGSSARAIT
jgi:CSLREA domain-containing protein